MLISFSVQNFMSFRDKAVLDLRSVESDTSLPGNIAHTPFKRATPQSIPLLKSAVVYGPNAGGKTNLLRALEKFRTFVCYGLERSEHNGTPFEPFALDPQVRDTPSEFEIKFLLDGTQYRYGFTADKSQVHEEWLFAADLAQERFIFERALQPGGEYKYAYGPTGKRFEEFERNKRIKKNALMLSVASYFNEEPATLIFSAISNIKKIFHENSRDVNEKYLPALISILRYADIGLHGIEVKSRSTEHIQNLLKMAETGTDTDPQLQGSFLELQESIKQIMPVVEKMKDRIFIYKDSEGHSVQMEEESQSGGTLRLLSLFNTLLCEYKAGAVLLCDEIDSSLHPMLSEALFSIFHALPENNTQLICTTHNAMLLNEDVFRRDQIWITEKDIQGNTALRSISDFKGVRKEARLGKQYLDGRFGGLPILDPRFLHSFIQQLAAFESKEQ